MPCCTRKQLHTKQLDSTVGGLVVSGSVVLYALLARESYVWMAAATVIMTAGMRVVMISSAIAVMRTLPREKTSTGAALSDTSQELGNSVGVAIAGTALAIVVGSQLGPEHADQFVRAETGSLLMVAAIATSLSLLAYRVLRPSPSKVR